MCEASLIIQVVVVRNRFIINAANNSNEDIKYSFNDPFHMKNVIDINHLDFNKQPKFLKSCRTVEELVYGNIPIKLLIIFQVWL